jgi:NTE family protein
MKKEKIAFALQGGGAHGAYTWGAMERLLEEDVLDMRGFCGTSAGALTSALIVQGIQKNGNKGAIDLLEQFWEKVSRTSEMFMLPQQTWMDNTFFNGNMNFSPYYQVFNYLTNYFAPNQFNPAGVNPLKGILTGLIDFDELQESKIKLFVAATKIRNGSCKVFSLPEISIETLLASACLPNLFPSVEINGEHYWDGGYSGNPPIYPLIYGTDSKDVLLIQINPVIRDKIADSAAEISNRVNEISFNSTLQTEMRMIMKGYDLEGKIEGVYFQLISSDPVFKELNYSSKFNTSREFLGSLRKLGREAAEEWLKNDLSNVGKKTSAKMSKLFDMAEEEWKHERVNKPADHLKNHPIGGCISNL